MDAAEIHLVETSPALRKAQATRISNATWHESIDGLPPLPLYLVANEFFDALPISQFEKTEGGWCERYVTLAPGASIDAPRFAPTLAPEPIANASVAAPLRNAPLHAVAEISPASMAIAQNIGERIAAHGGAALIIDYGHLQSGIGDTFQAIRAHGFANPYETPGEQDLTAHVDFAALALAAAKGGAETHGPMEQGKFLHVLGIGLRADRLKQAASKEAAHTIDTQVERLTSADQMGRLFKVLGLTPKTARKPSGFEE